MTIPGGAKDCGHPMTIRRKTKTKCAFTKMLQNKKLSKFKQFNFVKLKNQASMISCSKRKRRKSRKWKMVKAPITSSLKKFE